MTDINGRYRERRRLLFLLSATLLAGILLAVFFGRYPRPGFSGLRTIVEDPLALRILLTLRLPRVILSVLLGMVLGASGAVFQLIFGNPLVEPGFIGVSQGAAFGAALAIILWGNSLFAIQALSALFGCAGLLLSFVIGHRIRFGGWLLRLVLAGLAVSAFFSSGVGFLKYVADPLTQLPEITFWLLGGLSGTTWTRTISVLPVIAATLPVLIALRWKINLLSISDQAAFSLGISPGRFRILLVICATLPVTAVISVSGVIQWVGLVVPHIARRIFGVDSRFSLPGSIVIGGILGLLCDAIARVLLPGEIPLGIVTSLLGALIFILILSRRGVPSA